MDSPGGCSGIAAGSHGMLETQEGHAVRDVLEVLEAVDDVSAAGRLLGPYGHFSGNLWRSADGSPAAHRPVALSGKKRLEF